MKSAVFAALLVAAPAAAATPSGISDASLKADTAQLASDAFEGRKPGTPGGDKAVAYIEQRFAAIGLEAGNHGRWTQDVPLVTITTAPTPLVLSGCAGGAQECRAATRTALSYGTDVVLWTKRQVATQTLANSPVVFVGYGITAPEKGWDDYAGLDVRGKTVVILVNDPDWQTPTAGKDAGPFEGRAETYYGRYTYKFEEAARHGAAAAFVVHDTEPAGYGWNVITTSWTGPQIDLDQPDKGMGRVGVEGWITKAAFERMLGAAATGKDLFALTKAAQTKGFRAVPLGLQASATLSNEITHSASKNVIGVIPGRRFPSETVLVTAHWDHLGRCPADATGDDICNGAVDNASGVAGVLTLAEAFARGPQPARTVVFMAVTGEESGLLGSRWYAEHPVYPLALTAGGVNMDGLNVGGRTHDITISGGGKSDLDTMATLVAKAQGRFVAPEPSPEKGGYFRSDHFSFAKLGVPMLRAGSGVDRLDGGIPAGQAAAADYTAHRYHQPSDNYDPKWDWSGAVEDLDLYYAVLRGLADSHAWPNWYAGTEFKAIRDTTAGERHP
ncbi:MAG: M20/M25/M40 family metallo-hydrolase [Sphingomonadaceae bacterium]|nr:M20/M25/M40 family metallo-hydrolase [Sphingomonadaceae bacterium]